MIAYDSDNLMFKNAGLKILLYHYRTYQPVWAINNFESRGLLLNKDSSLFKLSNISCEKSDNLKVNLDLGSKLWNKRNRRSEDRFSWIKNDLESGKTLLDVACNSGWVVFEASTLGLTAHGVDSDVRQIHLADLILELYGLDGQKIKFFLNDALDYLSNTNIVYDYITCFMFLHHVFATTKEWRYLTPGEEVPTTVEKIDLANKYLNLIKNKSKVSYFQLRNINEDFWISYLTEVIGFSSASLVQGSGSFARHKTGKDGLPIYKCVS